MEIEIITAQRAVTAAGIPERVKEAPEYQDNEIISITIRAKVGNAGDVYITNTKDRASASTVGDIFAPGEVKTLDVSVFPDAYIDLANLWIDAANSGDAISYHAFKVLR